MPATDRKLNPEELARPSAAAHFSRTKRRIRLILDDVRSRHNVGSIFRTADAFGAEGIILCGFTPCPPHREIEKTALGATLSVPWETAATAIDAVHRLREEGYAVFAIEQTVEALLLPDLAHDAARPVALVLGNELDGVSEAVVKACDRSLMVPQYGSKHSLNVSVCAGVVLWHLVSHP